MIYVPKELIDTTWRNVGASTSGKVVRIQNDHKKTQRALTVYVYENFLGLREDAAGAGIYVYHVVLEAFSRVLPRPRRVGKNQVELARGNQHRLEGSESEKSIEQSSEPYALRYVHEALTEDTDDVVLSDQEREHIFGVLQAAIICLHEACGRE